MVTLKESYITQECRELLGITVVSVLRRAEKEHWQFRPRKGRGGGKEWLLASMPQATQEATHSRLVHITDTRRGLNITARALDVVHSLAEGGNTTIVTYGKDAGWA